MNTQQTSPIGTVQTSPKQMAPTGRVRSAPHPRYPLRQAEEMARKAVEIGARMCDQDKVAQAMKYKNASNGAFKGLRAAALYFGLVDYKNEHFLSVTEDWISAIHDGDDATLKQLRLDAMHRPELYRQLLEDLKDVQISPDKLAQRLFLTPRYGILKDAADTAARAFLESAQYAGMIDANNYLRPNGVDNKSVGSTPAGAGAGQRENLPGEREEQVPDGGGVEQDGKFKVPSGLDRVEVQLRNGRRAYLFVPVPLPRAEKERLKKYIDLILDETDVEEVGGPSGPSTSLGAG